MTNTKNLPVEKDSLIRPIIEKMCLPESEGGTKSAKNRYFAEYILSVRPEADAKNWTTGNAILSCWSHISELSEENKLYIDGKKVKGGALLSFTQNLMNSIMFVMRRRNNELLLAATAKEEGRLEEPSNGDEYKVSEVYGIDLPDGNAMKDMALSDFKRLSSVHYELARRTFGTDIELFMFSQKEFNSDKGQFEHKQIGETVIHQPNIKKEREINPETGLLEPVRVGDTDKYYGSLQLAELVVETLKSSPVVDIDTKNKDVYLNLLDPAMPTVKRPVRAKEGETGKRPDLTGIETTIPAFMNGAGVSQIADDELPF